MKKIEAVIRLLKVDEVKDALVVLGVGGMTVTGVRGVGHQLTHSFRYGGAECRIDLLPRAKIEIVVADNLVEPVVATICKVAWTGSPGDGKVFVLPLMTATRIRTGEVGETAL
jgi:nitrogen regulatory protein P-II 1